MNAGDDARSGEVHYSRGRNTYDAYPEQRTAVLFEAFADAVLADRSRAKGEAWISAPFARNDDGRHHRCKDGVLPRSFIAMDQDGGTPHGFVELGMYLAQYRGFGYTTARHTTANPRARFILELSRLVDRAEGLRVGAALQQRIEAYAGSRACKLDTAAYRGEQPLYTPLVGAHVMRYDGDPIDVDALLALAPKEEPRVRRADEPDPYRAALLDRGLVLRELGPGKDAIACPFAEDHSEATSETSTVYFWPRHGGYQWGGIHCLHKHCAERNKDQRLYIEKLGLDPRKVWRGQATGAALGADFTRVVIVRGDKLRVEPIRWQWDGWLARGKLHVLAGAPGAGKSTIALALAAVVTAGGRWPDGTKCSPGDVLVWSGEDAAADTLLPRLLASGGDRKRFHIVKGMVDRGEAREFDPATDLAALLAAARDIPECALVIVDPVVSAVLGDSHKNVEVRRALQPLVGFASDLDVAVLGNSHFTKGTAGRDPVERVTGSIAFGALPRVVMAAARVNEGDVERRIFCRAKSNIGPDTGGWEYRLELTDVPGAPGQPAVSAVYVQWGEVLEGSARDLLAEAETTEVPEERDALGEAEEWLGKLLQNGPVDAKEIPAAARLSGIAWRTLERAKTRLGVKSRKRAYAAGWWWSLPEHADSEDDPQRSQIPTPENLGGLGGLGKSESLEPSCGAGSTEDRQTHENGGQNRGVGGLRSNPGGMRVPEDREVEGRQDRQHIVVRDSATAEAADRTTSATCPRCDGEGCDWCGGLGRLVDDEPDEPAA